MSDKKTYGWEEIESDTAEEEDTNRSDSAARDKEDPVSIYFQDISAYPLLTREEEVSLAQQIEKGRQAKRKLNNKLLSEQEKKRLEEAVVAGEAARQKLIMANARLVVNLAKRRIGQGVPFLDLIQEGNMGLMHATEKFDWRRGYKFSTYATWWIRQALSRAIADQGRTIRLPIHRHEAACKIDRAIRHLTHELGREPTAEEVAHTLGQSPEEVETLLIQSEPLLSLHKTVGEYGDTVMGDFLPSEEPPPEDLAERTALAQDVRALLDTLPPREARIIELHFGLRDGREYTLKEVGDRFGLTRERIRQIEQDALERLRHPRRLEKLRAYLS